MNQCYILIVNPGDPFSEYRQRNPLNKTLHFFLSINDHGIYPFLPWIDHDNVILPFLGSNHSSKQRKHASYS